VVVALYVERGESEEAEGERQLENEKEGGWPRQRFVAALIQLLFFLH